MEEQTQGQSEPQQQPQNEASQQQEQPKQEEKKEAGDASKDAGENKLWAVLAYLGVLCLIPLLGKKDSPFAQFHAKQGLILLIGWVISWFPVFGWVIGIIVFILSVMGIINVFSGKMEKLPIVGDLAEKLNI